jgi:hypothetical protein
MGLPRSSLSLVCRAVADFISVGLDASAHSIQVMIGSPASAVPAATDTTHRINLFFYRIEPSGLFPGDTPGDPWWVRLHCLITGFGIEEEQISAGENDVRLLGEVMRLLHEHPVLPAMTVDEETFRLQLVYVPLEIDDINHIWSMQGDVTYRPSIAYEMTLVPVLPRDRRVEAPLVGRVGSEVRTLPVDRTAPYGGRMAAPPVVRSTVNSQYPGWAPIICFVIEESCAQSLCFVRGSSQLDEFNPRIWVAGETGSPVTLTWQRWTSTMGWHDVALVTPTIATTPTLDPQMVHTAVTVAVPFPPGLVEEGGQAVLYARRNWVRGGDGVTVTVRSNPLLLTIFGGS